jgi:formylglycine-generating enzyme required for sulfatase activity
MTKFSGRQIGELQDALLDAFPARDDLRMMVRIELDERLEAIADGSNQRVAIFNLVSWAERTGRIDDLVQGAYRQNQGNPALQKLMASWRPAAPPAVDQTDSRAAAPATSGPVSIDLFLSYSRKNLPAMRTAKESLRRAGLAVWTDEGLEPGTAHWQAAIEEAIAQAPALAVLLSPDAKTSIWVNREVAYAQTLDKRVFPVLIAGDERSAVPISLITAQWVDGRQDLRQALRQDLQPALLRYLGWAETTPPAPRPVIEFDWVTIPAGAFPMGSDGTKDKLARDVEKPQHKVRLDEFRIARVPVTVAQFAAFVQATGYRTTAEEQGSAYIYTGSQWEDVKGANWSHPCGPQSDVRQKQDHPVTCVSWYDTQAFCQWAGVRLPTEAEWEKAARGTDGRIFPWGDDAPTKDHCNFAMNVKDTTPVGEYPRGASPYGVLDMAGNVWEWTSSLFMPYPYDAADGREDSEGGESRTLRGGSWYLTLSRVRCASRGRGSPDLRLGDLGFRVLSPGFRS